MSGTGFLDDHANVAHGLLELHVATGEVRWLLEARRIALLAVDLFADDERGGFFLAPHDGERLATRVKDLDDEPTPVRELDARVGADPAGPDLGRAGARGARRRRRCASSRPRSSGRHAHFAWALCALDLHLAPSRELAIVGPVDAPVARRALAPFDPRTVVAVGPADDVPLLAGKGLVDGLPAVYVCERFTCRAPVTDPASLDA